MRRLTGAAATLGAVLAVAAPAQAATVRVSSEVLADSEGPVSVESISFTGAPGERNELAVANDNSVRTGTGVSFRDRLPISVGPGCSITSRDQRTARCTLSGSLFGTRQQRAFDANQRSALEVDLGDGDDRVVNNADVATDFAADLHGGAGNDRLENISLGYVRVAGDAGNDLIKVFGSEDDCGASGGGSIEEGAVKNGSDTVSGGNGQVNYADRTAGVSLTPDGKANDGERGENDNVGPTLHLHGGSGDDRLEGSKDNDFITGGAGADLLLGGAGNDRLYATDVAGLRAAPGPPTADRLLGGRGNDQLTGGSGPNTIDGGPGFDTLRGGGGDDLLLGRDGSNDRADCGPGNDQARLDGSDFTHVGARACERTKRRRPPTVVELGGDQSALAAGQTGDEDSIELALACPGDHPGVCRGAVSVPSAHGALAARRRFAIRRGQTRGLGLKPTRRGRRLILRDGRRFTPRGVRVRPVVVQRGPRGVRRHVLFAPRRVYQYVEPSGNPCP